LEEAEEGDLEQEVVEPIGESESENEEESEIEEISEE
jgi:hypothetical protein